MVDDEPVTPARLHVRDIARRRRDDVLFTANATNPAELHLWHGRRPGRRRRSSASEPGVHWPDAPAAPLVTSSRSLDRLGVQTRSGAAASRSADRVARRDPGAPPEVTLLTGRAAASCGARCCCRAGTSQDRRGCRCCSTPTAARPAAGGRGPQRVPDLAVVRRPGLRRAGRRRPGHPGPRAGLGARLVHLDEATPNLEDQVEALQPRRPRPTPTSICPGSASAAGRFGGYLPRSPCCAGPTSSTPRWPGPPSPTGGCTTPSTPSGTSATRTSTPRRTSATRCSRTRRTWSAR